MLTSYVEFPFKTVVMASLHAVFRFVEMLPTCYYANKQLRTLGEEQRR